MSVSVLGDLSGVSAALAEWDGSEDHPAGSGGKIGSFQEKCEM